MKKRCANEALRYIKDNTIIGLGGGSTLSYLISFIKEAGLNIEVVTPSFKTASLCIENGLKVLPTWSVNKISVAFDGCDEVDENLIALKSGGGIHTKEKIIATMADDYILLVDESKVVKRLEFKYPIVKIASVVGFSSQSYFSQVFRKETGLSPNKYRKSMDSQNEAGGSN